MKKYIISLVAVVFIFTGCSTTETSKTDLAVVGVLGAAVVAAVLIEGHHSRDFDDYVRSNGVPAAQYTTSNGDTIYSFIKPCSHAQGFEEKIVTVNSNNEIKDIYTQQTCP